MAVRPVTRFTATVILLVLPAIAAIAACSARSSPSPSSSAAAAGSSTSATTSASATTISAAPPSIVTVLVDGRTVTPKPRDVPVARGTTVRLVVTSRAENSLHVHGVDLERVLPAGTAVTVDLAFPDPGAYEVETHEPELRLLRFLVR